VQPSSWEIRFNDLSDMCICEYRTGDPFDADNALLHRYERDSSLTSNPRRGPKRENPRKVNMTLSLTFSALDLVKADASRAASGFPARGRIHGQPAD
jgi:hypothetical protein